MTKSTLNGFANITISNKWIQVADKIIEIKRKGLNRTIQYAINRLVDPWFDMRYGLDTERGVELGDLDVKSDNKGRGEPYQPVRVRQFRKLMNALDFPSDSVFVDLGSGKGRALLLASEYGFKRVVGVEFSPELCQVARCNWSAYRKKSGIGVDVQIVEADVADYEIEDDENVFFLNNPFDGVVLDKVLKNIGRSVEKKHRQVWLIYNHPQHRDIIERQTLFVKSAKFSHNFLVLVNEGEPFPNELR